MATPAQAMAAARAAKVAKLAAEVKAAEEALPSPGGLFGFVRKAVSGEPMNRREFMQGSMQAASAAAAARAPIPAGKAAAPRAEWPYLSDNWEDVDGFSGIRMEAMDGTGDPVLLTQYPHSWWDRADSQDAYEELDRLRRAAFDAYRNRPPALTVVPSEQGEYLALPHAWNSKTGQWHAVVYDKFTGRPEILKAGATPPPHATFPYGWQPRNFNSSMDMGIEAYGATPGELSSVLHREHGLALQRALRQSGVDPKKVRENPRYAEQATKYAQERGIAPGGRAEPVDLMGPSGPRVGPGDQSDLSVSSEYEPPPSRRDWRRYGVLGGLLLPAAMADNEESR